MIYAMFSCSIIWMGMTIASSTLFASSYTYTVAGSPTPVTGYHNHAAGQAALAMIFLFGTAYSIGITPLQALYPVEVLSFEMRAKGMAFSGFAVSAGGMLNQFAWPIALAQIQWKTYICFTIWCAVQGTVFYFFMPETRKRTLEELDRIFEARNPVKASLAKREVAVDAEGAIVASEDNAVTAEKV